MSKLKSLFFNLSNDNEKLPIRGGGGWGEREREADGNAGGEVSVPYLICAGKSRSRYLSLHCGIYTVSSLRPS